jgi:formamidopyrimidine-DNA glycosylase
VPELPDVEVYVECLRAKLGGAQYAGVRLASPFLLRSFDPRPDELVGRSVEGISRLGKRIVFTLGARQGDTLGARQGDTLGARQGDTLGARQGDTEGPWFVVLHLMVAGRLRWSQAPRDKIPGKVGLAAFDFDRGDAPCGTLILVEASTKKRASLHLVRGREALSAFDAGGIEPLDVDVESFRAALLRENHTLKRALTDPRLFRGIGNAYSDEILHRAQLSPVQTTSRLDDDAIGRLHAATRAVLGEWLERLRAEARERGWPEKVTAFRDGMAVHGRHGQPCPVCGSAIQRIAYAENETNYCARCQTGGRLLADRALSRLLKEDWPRTIQELEELRSARGEAPPQPSAAPVRKRRSTAR